MLPRERTGFSLPAREHPPVRIERRGVPRNPDAAEPFSYCGDAGFAAAATGSRRSASVQLRRRGALLAQRGLGTGRLEPPQFARMHATSTACALRSPAR
jgi:hypothetical protein